MTVENISATDLLGAIKGFKKEVNLCQIQVKGYDTSLFFIKQFLNKTYNQDMESVKEFKNKLEDIRSESADNLRELEKYKEPLNQLRTFKKDLEKSISLLSNRVLKLEKIMASSLNNTPNTELTDEELEYCDLENRKTKAKINRIKRAKVKEMLIAKT